MKKKYPKYLMVSVFFVSIVMLFLGCATVSEKEDAPVSSQGLEAQPTIKFSDIPVPARFKFLSHESYSFENIGLRTALLKYQGRSNPDQVVRFFKEQMSMYNWDLINIVEYGQRVLNFERENESCIITLFPKGNNITMVISLGPKSQLPIKKLPEKTDKARK